MTTSTTTYTTSTSTGSCCGNVNPATNDRLDTYDMCKLAPVYETAKERHLKKKRERQNRGRVRVQSPARVRRQSPGPYCREKSAILGPPLPSYDHYEVHNPKVVHTQEYHNGPETVVHVRDTPTEPNKAIKKIEETHPVSQKQEIYLIPQHYGDSTPLIDAVYAIAKGEYITNENFINILLLAQQGLTEARRRNGSINERGRQLSKDLEALLDCLITLVNQKNYDEKFQQMRLNFVQGMRELREAGKKPQAAQISVQMKDTIITARKVFWKLISGRELRGLLWQMVDFFNTFMLSEEAISHLETESEMRWPHKIKQIIREVRKQVLLKDDEAYTKKFYLFEQKEPAIFVDKNTQIRQETLNMTRVIESNMMVPQNAVQVTSSVLVHPEIQPPKVELIDTKVYIPEGLDLGKFTGWEKISKKFLSFLKRIASKSESREAFEDLYYLLKRIFKESQNAETERVAPHLYIAWKQLLEFLERFLGGRKLEKFFENLNTLHSEMKNNDTARQYWKDVKAFCVDLWDEPYAFNEEKELKRLKSLVKRGRALLRNPRYRKLIDDITKEAQAILSRYSHDPVNRAISDNLHNLWKDMMMDFNGKPSSMALKESILQMKGLIIPVIMKELEVFRLPRIEGTTAKYDFALENIIVNGKDLFPNSLQFLLESNTEIEVMTLSTDFCASRIILRMKNIRTYLRNVQFYYKRKKFPKVSDEGVFDVGLVGDRGATIEMQWVVRCYGQRQPMVVYAKEASCSLDCIELCITQGEKKFFDIMAFRMAKKSIKKRLQEVIADSALSFATKIADIINYLFSGIQPVAPATPSHTHLVFDRETPMMPPGSKTAPNEKKTTTTSSNKEKKEVKEKSKTTTNTNEEPYQEPRIYQREWEKEQPNQPKAFNSSTSTSTTPTTYERSGWNAEGQQQQYGRVASAPYRENGSGDAAPATTTTTSMSYQRYETGGVSSSSGGDSSNPKSAMESLSSTSSTTSTERRNMPPKSY